MEIDLLKTNIIRQKESEYEFQAQLYDCKALFNDALQTYSHLMAIKKDDGTLLRFMLNNATGTATIEDEDDSLFYPSILEGVDLRYKVYKDKVKEFIYINSSQADHSFNFNVLTENVDLCFNEDGSVAIMQEGKTIWTIEAPSAVDANGVDVPVSLEVAQGSYSLSIDKDPSYAYPITIDPTVILDTPYKIFEIFVTSSTVRTETITRKFIDILPNNTDTITSIGVVYIPKNTNYMNTQTAQLTFINDAGTALSAVKYFYSAETATLTVPSGATGFKVYYYYKQSSYDSNHQFTLTVNSLTTEASTIPVTLTLDTKRTVIASKDVNIDTKKTVVKDNVVNTDTVRSTAVSTVLTLDTLRRTLPEGAILVNIALNTVRHIAKDSILNMDTIRAPAVNNNLLIDTNKNIAANETVTADIKREIAINTNLLVDTKRRVNGVVYALSKDNTALYPENIVRTEQNSVVTFYPTETDYEDSILYNTNLFTQNNGAVYKSTYVDSNGYILNRIELKTAPSTVNMPGSPGRYLYITEKMVSGSCTFNQYGSSITNKIIVNNDFLRKYIGIMNEQDINITSSEPYVMDVFRVEMLPYAGNSIRTYGEFDFGYVDITSDSPTTAYTFKVQDTSAEANSTIDYYYYSNSGWVKFDVTRPIVRGNIDANKLIIKVEMSTTNALPPRLQEFKIIKEVDTGMIGAVIVNIDTCRRTAKNLNTKLDTKKRTAATQSIILDSIRKVGIKDTLQTDTSREIIKNNILTVDTKKK